MKFYDVFISDIPLSYYPFIIFGQMPVPQKRIAVLCRYGDKFWICIDSRELYRGFPVWKQLFAMEAFIQAEGSFMADSGIVYDIFSYIYTFLNLPVYLVVVQYLGMGTRLSEDTFVVLG